MSGSKVSTDQDPNSPSHVEGRMRRRRAFALILGVLGCGGAQPARTEQGGPRPQAHVESRDPQAPQPALEREAVEAEATLETQEAPDTREVVDPREATRCASERAAVRECARRDASLQCTWRTPPLCQGHPPSPEQEMPCPRCVCAEEARRCSDFPRPPSQAPREPQ